MITIGISADAKRDSTTEGCLDERAYVARLRAGDERALEDLFATYVPKLYRFIWRTMGGDNTPDVEDVLQETMVAALRSLPRYRGDCSLYTWLCAIARHKVQDYVRQQQRSRQRLSSETFDELGNLASASPSVEGELAQQQILEQALHALPVDYRTVLVGKYIDGLAVSELAQIMARSEKSVESLLTRARAALRERLVDASPGYR